MLGPRRMGREEHEFEEPFIFFKLQIKPLHFRFPVANRYSEVKLGLRMRRPESAV